MISWKGFFWILGTFGLAYLGQRQGHGAVWAIGPAIVQVVGIAFGAALAVFAGVVILGACGEIDEETEVDPRFIGAATLGVVYGVLILALVSGRFYPEDRAKARDGLVDRAADYLREQGEPVTVPNLKKAMRWVEDEEDEGVELVEDQL